MPDLPTDAAGETSSANSLPSLAVADYHGAWKNALDAYFPEFMELLWPKPHAEIDWAHQPVFLDQELQKLTASSKYGRPHVNKLVRVRLLTGSDVLALIHAEVQGGGCDSANLPSRAFTYHMHVRNKYPDHPLASLAVITHHGVGPTTKTYADEHGNCSLRFSFPVVYLESWRPRMSELLGLASKNPFAVVVLAQLEANARYPSQPG